uniref:Uncharacterized protein n=1 Tax=Pseudo-nitzschia australis TaxID=44445 RepID=A0A7S4AY11_9STRA|mmetsp:Transcript_7419/g.15930  ORF Transcript_7419/g.15930 Transcript_7419/m.15930 type:complete len:222 (+) Transcript_7419:198-863(+)
MNGSMLRDEVTSEKGKSTIRASSPSGSLASSVAFSTHSFDDIYVSDGQRGVKRTTFDKVFVYEFPLTLGDNPAVREGCPVALGTKCVHTTVVDLKAFENSRRSGTRNRRKAKDLYIPVFDRATILMSQGFTLEKIVQTVLEIEKIKKSRQECMKLNGWQKLNDAIDSAGKSLLRKFTRENYNKHKWNTIKNTTSNLNSDSNDIKGSRDQKRGNVVRAARTA